MREKIVGILWVEEAILDAPLMDSNWSGRSVLYTLRDHELSLASLLVATEPNGVGGIEWIGN